MTFRYSILVVLTALFITGGVATVWADNCGSNDRVALPACAPEWKRSRSYGVSNNCPYQVTVKVDLRNRSDHRFDLNTGQNRTWSMTQLAYTFGGVRIRGIHCCPRYNACSAAEAEE